MRSKKFLILCLTICLILSSIIVGCNNNKAQPNISDQSEQDTSSSESPEPLTLPIVEEPIKLTYWHQNWANDVLKTLDDMECFKEIQKRTNIDIEWQHPATGQESEQFNLMIASKDYPDLIHYNWFFSYSGGPLKALNDGVMIKLNDLIDKYAPNFKKILDEYPEVRKELVLDDGSIIMFPQIDPEISLGPSLVDDEGLRAWAKGFQIRKDWLDKLDLKPPTTIDEWYNVLKEFRDKDPNGNGQADEIPFGSQKSGNFHFQNFAGAWGVLRGFYKDPSTGRVKYGPIEAKYKDFLSTMAQWYKEGLIDQEYSATDDKSFGSKVASGKVGAYFGTLRIQNYLPSLKEKDPNADIIGISYPIGEAGKPYAPFNDSITRLAGYGTAISVNCKYPKEATKLLDYFYSEEGETLLNWGIEGKSYVVENGKKKFTDEIMNNPKGLPRAQAAKLYCFPTTGQPKVMDFEAVKQISYVLPEEKEANKAFAVIDDSLVLPALVLQPDEADRFASIMSEINTYEAEMFDKFIMGRQPLDAFDEYVNTIKNMGIDEAIKIQQQALDRFNAR